jgi:hypothetical protein
MSQLGMNTVASRPGGWLPLFYDAYGLLNRYLALFQGEPAGSGHRLPDWGEAEVKITQRR